MMALRKIKFTDGHWRNFDTFSTSSKNLWEHVKLRVLTIITVE